jgi:arsenate reductase
MTHTQSERVPVRILILCTGNGSRSQMAEGFLKSFDPGLEVYSAGTQPVSVVHPHAVEVMRELGIDISGNMTKHVLAFVSQDFDYVITVCDEAAEACPVFPGKVRQRIHYSFEDPAAATGSQEEIRTVFRHIRDEIRQVFTRFYNDNIKDR